MTGMRLLREMIDESLSALAFLGYVAVETAVILGMLKWTGLL
jgi:hypothetical protein